MRYFILLVLLVSCGPDQQEEFEINGELKNCQTLELQQCGLRVVCDDDTVYDCVTN